MFFIARIFVFSDVWDQLILFNEMGVQCKPFY